MFDGSIKSSKTCATPYSQPDDDYVTLCIYYHQCSPKYFSYSQKIRKSFASNNLFIMLSRVGVFIMMFVIYVFFLIG